MVSLLRLLHARLGPSNVPIDIGCIRCLSDYTFDSLPDLPSDWGNVLVGNCSVHLGSSLVNGPLYKAALAVPSSEEDGVDKDQYPATLGEGDSREKNAEPK